MPSSAAAAAAGGGAGEQEISALSAAVQRAVDAAGPGGGGLVQRVAARLFSDELQGVIAKFLDNNAALFKDLTPAHIASGENKLEWWSAYERFMALFDRSLEEVVAAEGGSAAEFAALAADEAKLTEDERCVIDLLRASSDYTAFLELMYDEVEEKRGGDAPRDKGE
jgi:hypothetical protein